MFGGNESFEESITNLKWCICVWCFANKNGGVSITQTNVFIIPLTNVSAQIGHHQAILEEYKNGDGMHIKCNVNIKFC
jgi:hypothetical protein